MTDLASYDHRPVLQDRHRRDTVFLLNLMQDVNILRGVAYLAARECDTNIRFLVSLDFIKRDKQFIWQAEIGTMAADLGATIHVYDSPVMALSVLQGRSGLLLAASETRLPPHKMVHDVLRIAPPGFVKITLQHGFEGAGLLQGKEHVLFHGRNITSGADILCSWSEMPSLTSLPAAQRATLYPTGPSPLLQVARPGPDHPPPGGGLICENLHSVRLRMTGDHGAAFMDTFFEFCAAQEAQGRDVTLRPHPGGQYVLRNKVALPGNVHLNNLPIYKVDLPGYAYGISAPSTVVMDMVLAGIPTAVWCDPGGVMDTGNYTGLTEIRGLDDWLAFEATARTRPQVLLDRQRAFLDRAHMIIDRDEIYRRFARLLVNATVMVPAGTQVHTQPPAGPAPAPLAARLPASVGAGTGAQNILFIANLLIPTLQLSFLKPLEPLFESGRFSHAMLTERELIDTFGKSPVMSEARDWFADQIAAAKPDIIVCCRYSGPFADVIRAYADATGTPLIYHIDDDLLTIPKEIGEGKFRDHNQPRRLATVRYLLDHADLVYCSTPALKRRFRQLGVTAPITVGRVYATSRILALPPPGPVRRIGYMGGRDHAHDLELAVPGLAACMDRHPDTTFEIFGAIPVPDSLKRFGDRIVQVPPVTDYSQFLQALADRHWDVGLCPLARIAFNTMKANTKWVEYTACGMAVVASKGMVYDDCAGRGAGLLVEDGGWEEALEALLGRPQLRADLVRTAQVRLLTGYSRDSLRAQIIGVFDRAFEQAALRDRPARPLAGLAEPVTLDDRGRLPRPAASV